MLLNKHTIFLHLLLIGPMSLLRGSLSQNPHPRRFPMQARLLAPNMGDQKLLALILERPIPVSLSWRMEYPLLFPMRREHVLPLRLLLSQGMEYVLLVKLRSGKP